MSAELVRFDRSMVIDRRSKVETGWVPAGLIDLECKDRMAIGDVERAYAKVLNNGVDCGSWPCPVGYWAAGRFRITDGRHEFIARLMLGASEIFVAWVSRL